jgi:hypothetical protein
MTPKIKSIKLKESTKDLLNIQPPEGFTYPFQEVIDRFPGYFEIEYEKPQTKYRKNGSLVFAPKYNEECFSVDKENFDVYDETFSSEENFNLNFPVSLLQQGLIFDNKEACQLWADKLKVAYALKQRIVESESQDEYLEKCVIWFSYDKKQYAYEWKIQDIDMSLIVSTNAKDILMADDVSDEDFKAFIEVFSL